MWFCEDIEYTTSKQLDRMSFKFEDLKLKGGGEVDPRIYTPLYSWFASITMSTVVLILHLGSVGSVRRIYRTRAVGKSNTTALWPRKMQCVQLHNMNLVAHRLVG